MSGCLFFSKSQHAKVPGIDTPLAQFSTQLEHQHHPGSLNSGISITSLLDTDHIMTESLPRALGDLSNDKVVRTPSPHKRKHAGGVGVEDPARQK